MVQNVTDFAPGADKVRGQQLMAAVISSYEKLDGAVLALRGAGGASLGALLPAAQAALKSTIAAVDELEAFVEKMLAA